MNAPISRCHCEECTRLDRLPVRRHGIPHAYQTTFDWPETGSGRWPVTIRQPAPSPDALPLFAGPLQPTLF